ncbi:MAG: S24/S26 family peptidase [Lacunisphaera sp.]
MSRGRSWWCWLVLACSATAAPAGEPTREWIRGIYAAESPPPIAADLAHAWQQASDLAAHTSRAFVLVGAGESMLPLYAPGTILVLCQRPYAKLKRGQTVLYRSHAQKVAAHVLVALTRDGWRAQGLNNRGHDMEPVQEGNLVGVVIAAYRPLQLAIPAGIARMP